MNHLKKKLRAVIFDMDGTIIKTEHIWDRATGETLKQRGIYTFSDEQKRALSSLSGIGMKPAWELLIKTFKLDDHINHLIKETIDRAHTHFETSLEFIDGFQEFHKLLARHKIPNAIATNADLSSLSRIAQTMKFEKYFGKNMFCVDHVQKPKPDPALFLHTAQHLGAHPHDCIVFEDSVYGFQAASAAGMKCIAIKNEKNSEHLVHAHDAIDNYHQALETLSRIV